MVSPQEGWAVGTDSIVHYDGKKWSYWQSLPQSNLDGYGVEVSLSAVDMLSAREGWAVGQKKVDYDGGASSFGVIWHYKDGAWEVQHEFSGQVRFKSVSMVSNMEGWAAGQVDSGPGVYHYSSGKWNNVEIPRGIGVNKLDAVSVEEWWGIGSGITHYLDGHWERVASYNALQDIQMLSPTSGWAVSYTGDIIRFDGNKWLRFAQFPGTNLTDIFMLSEDEGWAVGKPGDTESVFLHYANGQWSVHSRPQFSTLYGVVMTSSNSGWAVGELGMFYYQDGTWQAYKQPTR